MKALVQTRYGSPDVLEWQEVEKPAPNVDQLLIRVYAASVNPAEYHMRRGRPVIARMRGGLWHPKDPITGADIAGKVEAVGANITQYKPGDAVFGRRAPDGFAEYVCASVRPIALKPENVTFEEAAAIPTAGLTALQSLRDAGSIQPGQKVLINGASGGVGTFTVQIAKHYYGTHVTAVCSDRNLELVGSLGADRVIDYAREDFTRTGQCYDLIIDNVGNHSIPDYLRAMNPNGICVVIGYTKMGMVVQHIVLGRLVSRFGNKKIGMMMAQVRKDDLVLLKDLVEAGKIRPVIDRTYPFHEAADAYRYAETKHARGKVVVTFGVEG